ncbi:hypothetical protein H9Q09_11900 [Aurantimonas sp. DM33-3]|uniref:hypothetical protein n=1 Tax=Aurantimonas TaxID=182269 RepID=UPI001652AD8F|nr:MULTISPECIES: hypothetical protein [Aurantimonas]MBC6716911.1 hypothetical protein [Aurantimonas sp. DM33-3]MCC4298444.1 hypothetical protein [Aurantimonas coralicida]
MKAYLALVSDLDTVFDPLLHCDTDADGFMFTMRQTEAQISEVEIEMRQSGLRILAALANKNVLLSWSRTGDPADAELIARGYIAPDFAGVYDLTQRIRVICAPRDIEDRKLAYAKEHLAQKPDTDNRFSDFDEEDAETYLLGRSVAFYVDPVTHEVSVSDELQGGVHHSLQDLAFADEGARPVSSLGTWGYPPKTIRYRVTADWTQEDRGECNIAANLSIAAAGRIETLDATLGDRLPASLGFDAAPGWSLADAAPIYKVQRTNSRAVPIAGTDYEAAFDILSAPVSVSKTGGGSVEVRPDSSISEYSSHTASAVFAQYAFNYSRIMLNYEYSQPRQEILYFAMDVPLQPALATSDVAETVDLSFRDIFRDQDLPDYEIGTDYVTGDVVFYNGKYYESRGDHYAEDFLQPMPGTDPQITYWKSYKPDDLLDRGTTVRFFEEYGYLTDAADHVKCRARKLARRMLRILNVTVATTWLDGIAVTTKDDATIYAPDNQMMRGKVIAVERVWGGGDGQQPHVKCTIGVAFGTGRDQPFGQSESGIDEVLAWAPGVTDDPVVPVNIMSIRDGSGVVRNGGTVINTANDQLDAAGALENPTDISAVMPTYISGMKLTNLTPRQTLIREIDAIAELRVAPKGAAIDGY